MSDTKKFAVSIQAQLDTSKVEKQIEDIKKKFGVIKFNSKDFFNDSSVSKAGEKAGKAYSTAFKTQMRDKIQLKVDTGDFQTKIDSVQAKMSSLNQVSDVTKNNLKSLQSAFATMSSDTASLDEKINAYHTFNSILPTIRAQINLTAQSERQYAQSVREAMQEQITLSKSATLSNDIQTWMNNNTRAAEMYGEELRELQGKLKNNTDASALNNVAVKFREIKSEARASGVAVSQFGINFKQAVLFALGIGSIHQILSKCVQVTKEMVEATKDLDDAMAQLRIVTNPTEAEYAQFKKTIFDTSKEISTSAKDLIESSTVYARLGFSLDDSELLAKYTSMLKNVGDVDVSVAQDALTAIFKAFDKNVTDIEGVMDKLIEVGNNYPISVAELAEGINNSGSMLASAGNTYEETLSMLAAANSTVQDISKSSNGLRTIAARIRNTKSELDDLGEVMTEVEYNELVQGLTKYNVTLTDAQGNFRSTFDILKDLSGVFDELSNVEQAALAKMLAGTRQQNVFYSLIGQFDEAKGAMNSMKDSAGALQEAYDEYLSTTTAHIETFKAAFVELADAVIDSGFLQFFIDLGTEAIQVFTAITNFVDSIGGLKTVILAVAAALLIAKGGLIAYKVELIATAAIQKIITFFNAVKTAIINIINIIPNAVAAWKAYAIGTASASTAMQASIPVIGLVLAGLTALTAGIALASSSAEDGADSTANAIDDTNQKIKSLANTAKDSTEQLSKLSVEFVNAKSKLDGLSSTTQNYTTATENLRKGLKIEQSELQALIDKYGDYDTALQKASLSKLKADEIDLHAGVGAAFNDLHNAKTSDIIGSYGASRGINLENMDETLRSQITNAQKALDSLPDQYKLDFSYMKIIKDTKAEDAEFVDGLYISAKDASGEMVKAYGEAGAKVVQQYQTYKQALELLSDTVGSDNILYQEIYKNYSEIQEPAEETISSIKALNENLATQYILENNIGKTLPTIQSEFETYRQELVDGAIASNSFYGTQEDVKAAIDNILSTSTEFAQFYNNTADEVKTFTSRAEELTDALDNLQSTISSINDIKSNFDENGYYSTDDLQKLLELEPKYLNLLINEKGQIDTNSEAYKNYLAAKAKSLVLDQVKSLYETILQMGIEEAQAYANAKAYDEEVDSLNDLITATTKYYYQLALVKDQENNTNSYTEAMCQSFKTVANYAAVYNNWLNSLSSSTNEFTSATDSSTKSVNKQKEALEAQKDALENSRDALENYKDALEDAQDDLNSLIDLTIDYIMQLKEDEKSALEDQKTAYDELIERKKEQLRLAKEEKDNADELADKHKQLAKDTLSLAVANLDDSSTGKKAQKQAQDKVKESEKDLQDYLSEQEYNARVAALEKEQEAHDNSLDKQIAKIDEYLGNARKLYEDACNMIDNDTGLLYGQLWNYTYNYTTKTRAEFDNLWSSAQTAIQRYKGDNDTLLGVMERIQGEIYRTDGEISELNTAIDLTSDAISNTSDSIDEVSSSLDGLGLSISDYMSQLADLQRAANEIDISRNNGGEKTAFYVTHNGKTYKTGYNYNGDTEGNRLLAAAELTKMIAKDVSGFDNYGLGIVQGYLGVGLTGAKQWYVDVNGKRYTAVSKTKDNAIKQIMQQGLDPRAGYYVRQNIKHYASGTYGSKGGVSITQENGLFEAIFGKLSNGQYTFMNDDSHVFSGKATENLHEFADDPKQYISNLFGEISHDGWMGSHYKSAKNEVMNAINDTVNNHANEYNVEMPMQVHVQGDMTPATVNYLKKVHDEIIKEAINGTIKEAVYLVESKRRAHIR